MLTGRNQYSTYDTVDLRHNLNPKTRSNNAVEFLLEDLGSKNGTYVGGDRVTIPRQLADGDQVRLGSVVITFRVPQPSGATETAL